MLIPPVQPHLQRCLFGQTLLEQHSRHQQQSQPTKHLSTAAWQQPGAGRRAAFVASAEPVPANASIRLLGRRRSFPSVNGRPGAEHAAAAGLKWARLHPLTEGKVPGGRDALS